MSVNSSKEWYYANNGQRFGAFTREEMIGFIQTGVVLPESLVWHKKLVNWKKAKETEYKQFFETVSKSTQIEWYYSNEGQRLGPVTHEEIINLIKNGNISSESFVWHKRLGDWKKLRETKLKVFLDEKKGTLLKEGLQMLLVFLVIPICILSFCSSSSNKPETMVITSNRQAKKAALKAKKEETKNQEPHQQIPERNSYQQSQEQTATPSFEIAATPDEMVNAYKANTVAADMKYKGKRIKIVGTIEEIGKEILGRPYIIMKSNKSFYEPQLVFDKKYLNEISQLRKGEVLEAVCTGEGRGILRHSPILGDCSFYQDQDDTSAYRQEPQTGETQQQTQAYEGSYEPQAQGSTQQTLGASSTDISPLTDAEYKRMLMTSDELKRADYALGIIHRDIRNHPNFIGTKARDFTEEQLQWMRIGRDQDAHKFIAAGYDRVTAYTKVIAKRAKELYAFLQDLNSVDSNVGDNAGMLSNARVVIDGTTVRMRFGPSLNTDWLKWEDGSTRSPNRGERLRYLGSEEGWYVVEYLGQRFYVSKMRSHLEY